MDMLDLGFILSAFPKIKQKAFLNLSWLLKAFLKTRETLT